MKLFNQDFSPANRQPSGMTVPDGFFDDFQAAMEMKIDAWEDGRKAATASAHAERQSVRLTLRRRFILWTSVAACLGLFVGLALPFEFDAAEVTPAAAEYAEAETTETTQEQLEQDMMLAQLSDYDIFEFYYGEEY